MTVSSAFSRWGFRFLVALAATLLAWLVVPGTGYCQVSMDPPAAGVAMRNCMDCHRRPNLESTEGVRSNQALCLECHAKKECTRQVDGRQVPLRVDLKSFKGSRHQTVACLQCHQDVARSPHRSEAGAQCSSCHGPHGEATVKAPHLRVSCAACHHRGKALAFDAKRGQVVLSRFDDHQRPIGLADHTAPKLGQDVLCQRCHHPGNQVGAAAMVLPAKGVICFLCHNASFSIGSPWFGLALIIMIIGLVLMARFWLQGSVAGGKGSLHQKIADGSETVWRTIFSRRVVGVLKVIFFDVLLQRRLLKESVRRWFFHSLVFLSIMLRLGMSLFTWLVYQVWPQGSLAVALIDKNHPFTAMFNDLTGLCILLGIVLAMVQRLVGPKHVKSEGQDTLALVIIGLMVVAGFVAEGARILMTQVDPQTAMYSFVGYPLSRLWARFSLDWQGIYGYLWYAHALLAALFVAYLPFGKMRHMFTTPLSLLINRDLQ